MSYRRDELSTEPSFKSVHAAMTSVERTLFWLGIANFAAFIIGTLALGGDAINGFSGDGHYFLRDHRVLTEVSRSVFIYSVIHTLSIFVTHPLAMIAGVRGRSRARRQPAPVDAAAPHP